MRRTDWERISDVDTHDFSFTDFFRISIGQKTRQVEERKMNMESYDKAVDLALERDEDVETYLRWKTSKPAQDEFQALLEKYWNAMQKGAVAILFLLLFASGARADSVTNLAGKIHEGSETFTYQFSVDEYTGSLFDTEVLNGSVFTQDGAIGCHPCSTFYINDIYEFLPTETIILAEFGNWQLIGSASGAVLLDPPVATAEPMTLVLLFTGALYLWALSLKTRGFPSREYPSNHIFRKA